MLCLICLPKNCRKIFYAVIAIAVILLLSTISAGVYVTNNLKSSVKDNTLRITNPSQMPITIFSINNVILKQRIVNGEVCEYKLDEDEINEDLKLVVKFCILKFNVKTKIENK